MRLATLLAVALTVIVPFVALESWVRSSLFARVSYTNSTNLDATIAALRTDTSWTVVAAGDSEVRWGFDPDAFDAALAKRKLTARSFNLGIDGFSGSLYFFLASRLGLQQRASQLKVLLIGVQLVEQHSPLDEAALAAMVCDGALQRPIFTSAFARDIGIAEVCSRPQWFDPLVAAAESVSATIRYREQLRHFLLRKHRGDHIGFQSTGLPFRPNGFQPHEPIANARRNFEEGWQRVVAERDSGSAQYRPLASDAWTGVVARDGTLDSWLRALHREGVVVAFFALPTNPRLIDIKRRRADYARNSRLMTRWAAERELVFVDLGILDRYDPEMDFGDHRHLSAQGAQKFSTELAIALAAQARFRQAIAR